MYRRPRGLSAALACALLALAPAVHAGSTPQASAEPATPDPVKPVLGLMGTIPLYWGEADGIAGLLDGSGDSHWARVRLARDFDLRPLAMLDEDALGQLSFLLLAQPRVLGAGENVALDAWVRGGGRLLLFADPMLTGESRFAIGDRRRPQDVILLSPLLDHWGLDLEFDLSQPGETRLVELADTVLPVRLAGRFAAAGDGCALAAEGLVATCRIGKGEAVVLADAALLDLHDPDPAAPAALDWLACRAFGLVGDGAGLDGSGLREPENICETDTSPANEEMNTGPAPPG